MGGGYGRSSETVVVDAKRMSDKWGHLDGHDVSECRVWDCIRPGGSEYSFTSVNCHDVEINSARRSSKTHRVFRLLCVKERTNRIVELLPSEISFVRAAVLEFYHRSQKTEEDGRSKSDTTSSRIRRRQRHHYYPRQPIDQHSQGNG
ncbi:hypothetical protein LSH36_685g02024 [Paralvinella palmiformis]|uniref:Uncharacterized protein n=1 Tax=Paralvinella palmiformis TaxID=53620 RepID=A0AAD9MU14_9ANNE|nr:hypothetical protein LSH36_685g02024 [Paralvinella palmiformis]